MLSSFQSYSLHFDWLDQSAELGSRSIKKANQSIKLVVRYSNKCVGFLNVITDQHREDEKEKKFFFLS